LTIDCTKAFDSTNHEKLIIKLINMRKKGYIKYEPLRRIKFLLDNYYIRTDIDKEHPPIKITKGNP
jgi:hypothetical protein